MKTLIDFKYIMVLWNEVFRFELKYKGKIIQLGNILIFIYLDLY